MTALTITVAVLMAAHLVMILSEQLPVWRALDQERLRLEAEHGPAWIWEAELDVLTTGFDLARMASEAGERDLAALALDQTFATLDELALERERGKAEAGRRLAG